MRGRRLALGAVSAAIAVSATSAAADSDTVRVSLKPATGSPHTHFRVAFKAPASTGPSGSTVRGYEVSATGSSGVGCASTASAAVDSARAGQRVHVTLTVDGSTRGWCAGTFDGRVDETITPACGFRELCPDYFAVMTIGRFTFRVRGPSPDRG